MDNVIHIKRANKLDKPVFEIVNNTGCQHKRSILDTKLRKVTCRDCGAELDPIEVLFQMADSEGIKRQEFTKLWERISNLKKFYTELRKRLRLKSRYKCRHCGRYNEATLETRWNGEIKKVEFKLIKGVE